MKENDRKNKHMTLDDRVEIQSGLTAGMSFKAIAQRIGKDPTTVSKEVKLHAKPYTNGFTKINDICPKLLKVPYVCNGCSKRGNSGCRYSRRKYSAKQAQAEYEATLSESREGIPLNKESFYATESTVSLAVKNGQNIYHAIKANELPVSTATVYRHIKKGYYTISPINLPRAVKFRPRKSKPDPYVPKGLRIGRTYGDFQVYMAEHNIKEYVEMDTVIGRVGGKLIMTFHFTAFDFMFGLLLDNKTAAEAADKVAALKSALTRCGFSFGDVFPVLLTDNGGEFSNVFAFENNEAGEQETHLFFCDPNSPYQKPHIENNHSLFRGIAPSGTSFDAFTQDTVNLIFSHINAVKRKQFNGKSAYDLFTFSFSPDLAHALGISYISAKDVIQTPKLLK